MCCMLHRCARTLTLGAQHQQRRGRERERNATNLFCDRNAMLMDIKRLYIELFPLNIDTYAPNEYQLPCDVMWCDASGVYVFQVKMRWHRRQCRAAWRWQGEISVRKAQKRDREAHKWTHTHTHARTRREGEREGEIWPKMFSTGHHHRHSMQSVKLYVKFF